MDELMNLALENKWDDVIGILKNESPLTADAFVTKFFVVNGNTYPYEKWTDEQTEAFKELDSPERRTEYYLAKGEDNLTHEEWLDFKNCNP